MRTRQIVSLLVLVLVVVASLVTSESTCAQSLACDADVNNDGVVNIFDLAIVADNFGTTTSDGRFDGDVNGDGIVNIYDLTVVAGQFGHICQGLELFDVKIDEPFNVLIDGNWKYVWINSGHQGRTNVQGTNLVTEEIGPDQYRVTNFERQWFDILYLGGGKFRIVTDNWLIHVPPQ